MRFRFLLVAGLMIMTAAACHPKREAAGSASTGLTGHSVICGKVTTAEGKPISDASMTITGPALSGTRTANTDKRGYYYLPQLPSGGGYKILVRASGWPDIRLCDVTLPPWFTLRLPFALFSRGDPVQVKTTMIDYTKTGGRTTYTVDPASGELRPQ
jgi:hypothetical protein